MWPLVWPRTYYDDFLRPSVAANLRLEALYRVRAVVNTKMDGRQELSSQAKPSPQENHSPPGPLIVQSGLMSGLEFVAKVQCFPGVVGLKGILNACSPLLPRLPYCRCRRKNNGAEVTTCAERRRIRRQHCNRRKGTQEYLFRAEKRAKLDCGKGGIVVQQCPQPEDSARQKTQNDNKMTAMRVRQESEP